MHKIIHNTEHKVSFSFRGNQLIFQKKISTYNPYRADIYLNIMNKHAFSHPVSTWVKVGGPLSPGGSWGRRSFSPAQKTRRAGKIVFPLSGCRSLTRLIPLLCSTTDPSLALASTQTRTDFNSSHDSIYALPRYLSPQDEHVTTTGMTCIVSLIIKWKDTYNAFHMTRKEKKKGI